MAYFHISSSTCCNRTLIASSKTNVILLVVGSHSSSCFLRWHTFFHFILTTGNSHKYAKRYCKRFKETLCPVQIINVQRNICTYSSKFKIKNSITYSYFLPSEKK